MRRSAYQRRGRDLITTLILRNALADDVEQLSLVWSEGWNEAHGHLLPDSVTKLRTREFFRARLAKNLASVRVAAIGSNVVALAITSKDELDELYVTPSARGQGAAAALVSDAVSSIRSAGYRRAWLACAVGNEKAARFYHRLGWSLAGPITIHMSSENELIPVRVWRFELDL